MTEGKLHNGNLAKLSMAVSLLSVLSMIVMGIAANLSMAKQRDFVHRNDADRFTINDARAWCDEFRKLYPDMPIPEPRHYESR